MFDLVGFDIVTTETGANGTQINLGKGFDAMAYSTYVTSATIGDLANSLPDVSLEEIIDMLDGPGTSTAHNPCGC